MPHFPRYLVRQRHFNELKRTAYGSVASYGPWRTLRQEISLDDARRVRDERSRVGLQQTVVTYRGRTVIDTSGRQILTREQIRGLDNGR